MEKIFMSVEKLWEQLILFQEKFEERLKKIDFLKNLGKKFVC